MSECCMDKIEKNKAEIEQRLEVLLMEIEAENERLRTALEEIRQRDNGGSEFDPEVYEIARRALQSE